MKREPMVFAVAGMIFGFVLGYMAAGLGDRPASPGGPRTAEAPGHARAASGVADPPKRWVAKWGYPELVRNPLHTDLLTERDPTAIEIFNREVIAAEARATKTSDDGQ